MSEQAKHKTLGTSPNTRFINALFDVRHEAERAIAKYKPFNSSHEGYAVLKEEVDEMWDAIKKKDLDGAQKEAVQVAAMAIRYLIDVPATKEYTP